MKTKLMAILLLPLCVVCTSRRTQADEEQPQRLLVVSTTMGFRHSSIPVAENVIRQLAERSGKFTLDFASVDPNDPEYALTEEEQNSLAAEADRRAAAAPAGRRGNAGQGGARRGARGRRGRGRRNKLKIEAAIKQVLDEKMNPDALKNYGGVIFVNTTGTLPIPDVDAFLNWIKDGHAFIGMHAASDTFHGAGGTASNYTRMLNGEFKTHGSQETVELINVDPAHVINADLPPSLTVHEEMYLFKNYQRSRAHSLLNMNEHPNKRTAGHYPVSWCRSYGQGRVFYTSLGHREDIWDPSWLDRNGSRANPPSVAVMFQKHILGGIHWAIGLAEGDSTPQVTD